MCLSFIIDQNKTFVFLFLKIIIGQHLPRYDIIVVKQNLTSDVWPYISDIDECADMDSEGTFQDWCTHGDVCINTAGSWNCTCPKDRLWMSIGNKTHHKYRCQGNCLNMFNNCYTVNAVVLQQYIGFRLQFI